VGGSDGKLTTPKRALKEQRMDPVDTTKIYVRHIIMACRESDNAEFMVTEILREYAAKVYKETRNEFAAEVARLA
jgi:hypothetical protein